MDKYNSMTNQDEELDPYIFDRQVIHRIKYAISLEEKHLLLQDVRTHQKHLDNKKKPSKLLFIKEQMKRFFAPVLLLIYIPVIVWVMSTETSIKWLFLDVIVFALCMITFIYSIPRWIKQ
jgi:hypothetical protein